MAITGLTLTVTLDRNQFAIGQPINFSIAATGVTGSNSVVVQVRKASDDVVSISKTVTVSGSGAVTTTGQFFDIYTRTILSSYTNGYYYFYCYYTGNIAVNSSTDKDYTCELLTPWMLLNVYGSDYLNSDDYTNDYALQNAIFAAYDEFFKYTDVHIKNMVAVTDPSDSETHDINIHPIAVRIASFRESGIISMPSTFINRINKIELYWGQLEILDIPAGDWVNSQTSKRGQIELIPTTGSAVLSSVGATVLAYTQGIDDYGYWHIDYECGWDETVWGNYEADMFQIMAYIAILKVKFFDLDGGSLSMDGVSESLPNARDSLDKEIKRLAKKWRETHTGHGWSFL